MDEFICCKKSKRNRFQKQKMMLKSGQEKAGRQMKKKRS
jgi:hypothetical protein